LIQNQKTICDYLSYELGKRVHLYGVPRGTQHKVPVFSFTAGAAHHEDIALLLDKMGIAVRSGQMCAEPLMDRFGVTGMVRASLAPYNTMEEAELFVKSLDKAISMLL
jgi:cysteine desulfurase/selenocysteine lyase